MEGYGWDEYDARLGGRQTIHDTGNKLDLTTDFVKFPGGEHGGGWGVRVKGVPRADAPEELYSTVVFYAGLDGLGSVEVANEPDPLGFEGTVSINGDTKELGKFTIDITAGPDSNRHPKPHHDSYNGKPLDRTMVASLMAPEGQVWQAKPLMFHHMKSNIDEYIAKYGNENSPPPYQVFTVANDVRPGNLHIVQKVFEGPFEFDIIFSSGSASKPTTAEDLTAGISRSLTFFSEQFKKRLPLQTPFNTGKFDKFAKSLFSNLLGGIGYFHGEATVDRSSAPEYEEENEGFDVETEEARQRAQPELEGPHELFTSIPSRPFFPRGFYWDEGFHLLPIADWDMDLTLDIVRSWFRLMDDDGWIAREQILGLEARSKVPPEFQVQYPHYANPPTLFMILEALVDKIENPDDVSKTTDKADPYSAVRNAQLQNPEELRAYLRDFYPLLKRHYFWFRKTQWGDIKSYDREASSRKEAYRWRGRSKRHILTSGLDDYPRPQPPHPGELHTDLISWMGMMTRSMRRIADVLGEEEDVKEFGGYEKAIIKNIDDLHWDKQHQTYCDATIDDFEEDIHVCHKGYISIFPFMTGLMPANHPHLKAILNLIEDPEELWSDYGIRSLSKKDEFYGTDENYWRSPVWMNMNYMILKNLYVGATRGRFALANSCRMSPKPRARTRCRRGACTRSSARI
jgi:mannosyl-oligosaccharide glucosidase